FLEEPVQAPETDPAAEFVQRLRIEIAHPRGHGRTRALKQTGLRLRVAVRDRVFRSLLVVEDEVDRDPGAPGPGRVRTIRTVADQIALHGMSFAGFSWRHKRDDLYGTASSC